MVDPKTSNANETVAESGAGFVNILVVSPDLTLAKSVQTACQDVATENADKKYRVFPGTNKEKVIEAIDKYVMHSILVEEEFLVDTTAEKYLRDLQEALKKKPENANVPVILVTSKSDAAKTRAMIRCGWKDVLLKPLDKTLFLQKMSLYNPTVPFLNEPILFSMDLKKDVDISFTLTSGSISEYGMKVESSRDMSVGSVVGISASFLEGGHQVSAVVVECKKISDTAYAVQLMFVGVTPAETQAIRKLIRHEYAEEKQAA